jgi:hypothetical protein
MPPRDIVPEIDTGSIQLKDRPHVDEALRADRLQFADHVMIDTGDSSGYDSSLLFDEDLGEMTFMAGSNFRAVAVDIFGKEYPAEITEGYR